MKHWLALAAVLAAALGTIDCGRQGPSGVSLDSRFSRFIAPDTRVLADLNVEKLKAARLYQRHENALDFPLLNGTTERIGLDPRRDLSDIAMTWNGHNVLLFVHGRLAPTVITHKLLGLGAQTASYNGQNVLTMQDSSICFFQKGVALAGARNALHQAIDVASNGTGGVPQELEERLHTVPQPDQLWAVSRGGLPFADVPMRSDYASALSNIAGYVRDTSVGVSVDTGIHLMADLSCTSEQGAQRVHDGLHAAVALGRLTTKDDQQVLLQIYDAIRIDRDKQTVQVRADFSSDESDKLLGYLTNFSNQTRRF